MSSKQLDECRAEARVKDRELEESEERHQMEVKVYKQKVKHLLYEQENHLADLKAENMVSFGSIFCYYSFFCDMCCDPRIYVMKLISISYR